MINHYFFIFTVEDDAATQRPRRGRGSLGGRLSGSRCRGRRGRGADESESPPPVASTAAKKKEKEGPSFPPEPPPTLLLTERDHTEAEKIQTEHRDHEEDVSAFDAYNQVVVKAELLWTAIINVMGADASRKADTYTIHVRNPWGIAFSSQVQIVCILPHQLAPGETQPHIVVKSLTDAITGADALDDLFQDNPELVPEIPTEFVLTQTQDREWGVRVTPHRTLMAEGPPPRPIMAEDGRPAVRGKEDGSAMVSTYAKVSCM